MIVTDDALVYVPATGLNAGVATVLAWAKAAIKPAQNRAVTRLTCSHQERFVFMNLIEADLRWKVRTDKTDKASWLEDQNNRVTDRRPPGRDYNHIIKGSVDLTAV